jgi:hypothetical protein
MIERIGLVNFLEGIGLDVDPHMINTPRTNPYVRTDGWDEEVAKIEAKRRLPPKHAAGSPGASGGSRKRVQNPTSYIDFSGDNYG